MAQKGKGSGKNKGDRPKRPMSAYLYFTQEERPRVKKQYPAFSVIQQAQEMGKRWQACTARGKFEAMAKKDKDRYTRESAAMKPKNTGPKRPMSAYMFFTQVERPKILKQHKGWGVPQVGAEMGQRWRNMSAGMKQKFNEQAAKDKQRYDSEVARAGGKKK